MQTPSVSAFIRSYRKDFPWLAICLKALAARGQQFSAIVVAVPKSDFHEASDIDLPDSVDLVTCDQHTANGYIDQQITKCLADVYCPGDFIMHFDSDCIATRDIDLKGFFACDGMPKLLFRRWEDAGEAQAWRLVTKGVLQQDPLFETMASHPFVYHRSTHELFRNHVARLHGGDFLKYASRLAQFSEFNAIGNFAMMFTPDAYKFIRATGEDDFPRPFKQFWSHDRNSLKEAESLLS